MECKTTLRRAILERRDRLPAQEIRRRSAAACSRLHSLPEFQAAGTVMVFMTFRSEIDTVPTIQRALADGKRLAAPRVDQARRALEARALRDLEHDLAPGVYGIPEPGEHCPPVDPEQIELVLVPAAVWGEDGYRIGYGAGYYDRFLPRARLALRVGLGFEMQVVPQVPHDEHDLPVDVLVTDARVRRFGRRAEEASG